MATLRYYFSNQSKAARYVNAWDFVALFLIFAVIIMLGWGAGQMATPYKIGTSLSISLSPSHLPGYAVRTVLRMLIALVFSLLAAFTIGTWAAKSPRAEKIIIPMIDVLQSVPVLSFLSITIVGFIRLFPHSLLGPECASIFVIFTSQAWNMILGFYQSIKTVPFELVEASEMFQLSAWQRFWRLEVPFSMSSLLWNTMMSMSASWFFVVLSEAISVANQNIRLPGIGSYIAVAIEHADKQAVVYAIIAMLVVIFLYDQLLFRPLLAWSEKFKIEQNPGDKKYRSWVMSLLQLTRLLKLFGNVLDNISNTFVNSRWFARRKVITLEEKRSFDTQHWTHKLWMSCYVSLVLLTLGILARFIIRSVSISAILHVFYLGTVTSLRVIILIIISSIIWIPVGVWIGMRPRVAQTAQPIIQFLAAFPANLIYPVVVIAIVKYKLNVEIWITPLMILGTQWYILFNVIAGASNIPKDLYQAAASLGLKGRLWWWRLAIPGIFPFFITGAITAAGGAWNASIVAEWVSWGPTVLRATGLGEYIHSATNHGQFTQMILGTVMMCLFVLAFNRIVWQPLYRMAETRFNISST